MHTFSIAVARHGQEEAGEIDDLIYSSLPVLEEIRNRGAREQQSSGAEEVDEAKTEEV
jgi:hypothetical protein